MELHLDHLVIAARTLEEGVDWVERRLGVAMGPHGRHDVMGTHNRTLSLGPKYFLEVIAIDPGAKAPPRARWFDLDSPAMQARLARGPALVHWAMRTDDIEAAIAAATTSNPEIIPVSRGQFRWKIGVPADGHLADGGISPTILQWFTEHPAAVLPDAGCRLESLVLRGPRAPSILHALRFAGLAAEDPVQAHHEGVWLEAHIRTPRGLIDIRE